MKNEDLDEYERYDDDTEEDYEYSGLGYLTVAIVCVGMVLMTVAVITVAVIWLTRS